MGLPALNAKSKANILIASLCARRKIYALFPHANRGKKSSAAGFGVMALCGHTWNGPNSVKPDRRANEPAATNGFCN